MKIKELIEGIASAYLRRVDGSMAYICLHLKRLNDERQVAEIYDTVYDIDCLLESLVDLLRTPIEIAELSTRGLPSYMEDEDFDKFSAIGEQYMAELADDLSRSMLARIGILVEYGIERDVPMIVVDNDR